MTARSGEDERARAGAKGGRSIGRGPRRLIEAERLQGGLLGCIVGLRWSWLGLQVAVLAVVLAVWRPRLPLVPLAALLCAAAASNLALGRHGSRLAGRDGRRSADVAAAALVLDVLLLTGLLALTGGPANPFSILYLVQVMLVATVAGPPWVVLAVALSSLGFGALFHWHLPLPARLGGGHEGGHLNYAAHLEGMWLAHTLCAATIAAFVSALSQRLRQERQRRERTARLLGLATLAAGAAHEIGNPLATIRVAAGELRRELGDQRIAPAQLEDLDLINREVERASGVLKRLAASAGELRGEPIVATDLRALLEGVSRQVPAAAGQVRFVGPPAPLAVRWPVQAVSQVLSQLLRNALQASQPSQPVMCRARPSGGGVALEVTDSGVGMLPSVFARVGEPFFTTRPGRGMGLGVFIARSLVEHLGGDFSLESNPGHGTTARIWLPSGAVG